MHLAQLGSVQAKQLPTSRVKGTVVPPTTAVASQTAQTLGSLHPAHLLTLQATVQIPLVRVKFSAQAPQKELAEQLRQLETLQRKQVPPLKKV